MPSAAPATFRVLGLLVAFLSACAPPSPPQASGAPTVQSVKDGAAAHSPEPPKSSARSLAQLLSAWSVLGPESRRAFCAELLRQPEGGFERCTLETLGLGSALLVRLVGNCGGDSCSTRGWIRNRSMTEFGPLPFDVGAAVEANLEGTALFADTTTDVLIPGSAGRDPFGGTEPVITTRVLLPSFDATPFAPCFSARLSPSGKWLLCRDRAANVLRVPAAGGPPERVVFSGRRPDQIEFVPYSHIWPEPVDFPSPDTLGYSISLGADTLGGPATGARRTVRWSDELREEDWDVRFFDQYPEPLAFSLDTWTKEHHVAGPTSEQRCWELGQRVGIPPAPGLLCLTSTRTPLTRAHIYRLQDSRLREVFVAIVATYANWLELTPLIQADGSLLLTDRCPGCCAGALAQASEKADAGVAPPSAQYLGPACAAVGSYRYENGQYLFNPPALVSRGW
jgi:hypothetical protein